MASTLEVIRDRLVDMRDQADNTSDSTDRLLQEDDLNEGMLEELLEELDSDEDETGFDDDDDEVIDRAKLEEEIREVEQYIRWARSIGIDTKTKHLLRALNIGYEKRAAMGAAQNAGTFTEPLRPQAS